MLFNKRIHWKWKAVKEDADKEKASIKHLDSEARAKYDAENKLTFRREIAKLFLNNLYGKFGQRYLNSMKHYTGNKKADGTWEMEEHEEENNDVNHIVIAARITSLARMVLIKALQENVGNVLYCDTDSIWLSAKQKGLNVNASEFGAWKKEHDIVEFKAIQSKCYMYKEEGSDYEFKIAGCSEKSKVNINNFFAGSVIVNGKKQQKVVEGGILIVETNFTIGAGVEENNEDISDS